VAVLGCSDAEVAVRLAVQKAITDENRPVYHFHPPAQRMNDPNGLIFYKGYYHLFYQYNPFADRPAAGAMHWGHARSIDTVHWETLPLALVPATTMGEAQCFSGCCIVNAMGQPMIFYTKVPPTTVPREQWAAIGDENLIRWKRHRSNPILSLTTHDGPDFSPYWRDPFIFSVEGRTFMVLCAECIPLYEAVNKELTKWTFRSILYDRPGLSAECPNFFQMGNKWVLLMSPKGPVEYLVGSFNIHKYQFTPESTGYLNHNKQYYATQVTIDPNGRCLLFGLIKGFPAGKGWKDCLALPRQLSLDTNNQLRQTPVKELELLRNNHIKIPDMQLNDENRRISNVTGDCIEICANLDLVTASRCGLKIRCSQDSSEYVGINIRRDRIDIHGTEILLPSFENTSVFRLRLFLDKGALEVFVNDGLLCEVRVLTAPPQNTGIEFFAHGGQANITMLNIWTMKAIYNDQETYNQLHAMFSGNSDSQSTE
jgi:beta-fructofuranosidase